MKNEFKAVLSGLATHFPGYSGLKESGSANTAAYCYSVWLRHLVLTQSFQHCSSLPKRLVELGPGASIGVGLSALLSGVEQYFAVDVVSFSEDKKNLEILSELTELYNRRVNIPGENEFPRIKPGLENYEFPRDILTDKILEKSLAPARVERIRQSIVLPGSSESLVHYAAPWNDQSVIESESIDLLISQAVLEHVVDLDDVYASCFNWLKPGALMCHHIDFKSHGKATEWNGHWKYPDWLWMIIVGTRPFLINREPLSTHILLLEKHRFKIENIIKFCSTNKLDKHALPKRFNSLSEADMTTSSAAIISSKPLAK